VLLPGVSVPEGSGGEDVGAGEGDVVGLLVGVGGVADGVNDGDVEVGFGGVWVGKADADGDNGGLVGVVGAEEVAEVVGEGAVGVNVVWGVGLGEPSSSLAVDEGEVVNVSVGVYVGVTEVTGVEVMLGVGVVVTLSGL